MQLPESRTLNSLFIRIGHASLAALGGLLFAATLLADPATTEPTGKHWVDMNYGPYLTASIEAPSPDGNITYKGLAVRVAGDTRDAVSRADCATMLFDTDLLRYSVAWTGGFLRMTSIVWDGAHGKHPSIRGEPSFVNRVAPGWSVTGVKDGFDDPRELPYGPLPREQAHYKGLYLHEDRVVLSYTVGDTRILELPGLEERWGIRAFSRTIEIDALPAPLTAAICDVERRQVDIVERGSLMRAPEKSRSAEHLVVLSRGSETDSDLEDLLGPVLAVGCVGAPDGTRWRIEKGSLRLDFPRSEAPVGVQLLLWRGAVNDLPKFATLVRAADAEIADGVDLHALTRGGAPRWPERMKTRGELADDSSAYAADVVTLPFENPWNSSLRLGGLDFFRDDARAAVATWLGDVWLVSGIDASLEELTWQRIATGLFQPLGLKIVDDEIYVLGRDQITILRDLNGDGETDFYENFNNDAQATEHFHEFAMDLQTDSNGDFYYMKGGRHAKDSVVPQHGSLLKVAKDGSGTEFVAYGFRAPNGLCVNPDGSFVSSDQQGHWTPANRINWIKPGGFYGYMWAYHRGEVPETYDRPLCWIHNEFDRSPSSQVWVDSDRWGPLGGHLIAISYGTGYMEIVLHEEVAGQMQGGMARLPVAMFPTGIHRSRVRPSDGQLYLCGLFGWAGNRTQPGGFFRVRYTGKPLYVPVELHAKQSGVDITFSGALDARRSANARRFSVQRWNYKWSQRYGSEKYRLSDGKVGVDEVEVKSATITDDSLTVRLEIPDMKPCMQMRIQYNVVGSDGSRAASEIYHTVHALGDGQ